MTGADVRMAPNVLFIKPAERHLYNGKWVNAEEMAELSGIPYPTLRRRLREGRPIDVAGKPGPKPKLFLFRNQMMTVTEIAKLTGLDKSTVYDRVSGNRVLEGDELRAMPRDQPSHACLITYKGRTLNQLQWARELGISLGGLRTRIRLGWTMERIVNEPVMKASVRGTLYRNRSIIKRMTRGFRRVRNRILIQRITNAFRLHTPGYVQTFTNSQGTGVGSRAVERGHSEISLQTENRRATA